MESIFWRGGGSEKNYTGVGVLTVNKKKRETKHAFNLTLYILHSKNDGDNFSLDPCDLW